ncbi:hypothetical protein RhiJN_10715 [Ceratobasidium sp. AG-Ba]|nr:hypothetical protein RhiJN_10715 [Ceratobasidium sp. AG-Ba]
MVVYTSLPRPIQPCNQQSNGDWDDHVTHTGAKRTVIGTALGLSDAPNTAPLKIAAHRLLVAKGRLEKILALQLDLDQTAGYIGHLSVAAFSHAHRPLPQHIGTQSTPAIVCVFSKALPYGKPVSKAVSLLSMIRENIDLSDPIFDD